MTGLASTYTFPLIGSLQPGKQQDGEDSLFVSKIGLAGNVLLYSTFVRTRPTPGGDVDDGLPSGAGNAIAVDSAGNAYVATEDAGGFEPTTGAFQTANKGGQDAVVFKLSAPSVGMTLSSSANPASSRTPTTLTATVSDPNLTGSVIFMDGSSQLGSAPLNGGTAILTTALSAGVHRLTAVYRSNPTTADSAPLHLVVNTDLVCN